MAKKDRGGKFNESKGEKTMILTETEADAYQVELLRLQILFVLREVESKHGEKETTSNRRRQPAG